MLQISLSSLENTPHPLMGGAGEKASLQMFKRATGKIEMERGREEASDS